MSISNGHHHQRGNISIPSHPAPFLAPPYPSSPAKVPFSTDDAASDDEADHESSAAHTAYYHPISAFDDGSAPNSDSEDHAGGVHEAASPIQSNGGGFIQLANPSPNVFFFDADACHLSALDLNGGVSGGVGGGVGGVMEEEVDDGEAEEEEERARQLEASISTAFREDDRRRSAPLTPENAARVLDAMRGVAFRGVPPDWADQVPEDQWVDRLRRMRGESSSPS
ncbi:hypothetical protein Cni_G23584 [Canna indica]|uniref:Uncharacterized protein n=1 Tax=Canna indica TaxID=4628 RepID=A0AAQ3QMD4_9LILI|nr:hypothetical protein Cni_G23584 [Canna indica]